MMSCMDARVGSIHCVCLPEVPTAINGKCVARSV